LYSTKEQLIIFIKITYLMNEKNEFKFFVINL